MTSSVMNREASTNEIGRMVRLMSPPQRIIVFVMLPLLILGGIQLATQALVMVLVGRRDFTALPVFGYIAQWWSGDPAANYGVDGVGVLHWVIAIVFLATGVAGVALATWAIAKQQMNPQLRPGLATDKQVKKELATKQLVEQRGPRLSPSLAGREIQPGQVGFLIGVFRGREIWIRMEDPTIIIGPSRAGKGWRLLLNMILSAPGAVITTSVKLDNAKMTMKARERSGSPCLVWAPGIPDGKELGHVLKWDPVVGCIDEETLVRRVNALIPSGSFSGSTSNGGHWDSLGKQLAEHLFHAAACGGVGVDEIWGWVTSPKKAEQAVDMIREHALGMNEHADHLEYVINMPHEQRATSWGVLPTVLAFMASRSAREWMKPEPGEEVDLVDFLVKRGTLYIVGDKMASPVYVRMNDALLAEIDYITKGLAAASPGSRMDPAVTYILDEAGNIEYQGMYELITAGGGYGRVAVAVFQSKNQLEQFGDASTGATLWDAAVAKIILPGGGDPKALAEVSELIGEAWFERASHTVGSGDPSAQLSDEKRAIFSKEEVRTLEQKYAVMFYRNLPPVIPETMPFDENPRFAECMADAGSIDEAFMLNSRYAEYIKPREQVQ